MPMNPLLNYRTTCLIFLFIFSVDPWLGSGNFFLANAVLNADELSENEEKLYEPKDEDFEAAYNADTANAAKQKRSEYYQWARTFYNGTIITKGWNKQAKLLIAKVSDKKNRKDVTVKLNDLGLKICREWSKDNGVRKVNTDDLSTYSRQFDQAVKKDDGSGTKLLETIAVVDKAISKKLQDGNSTGNK